MTDQTIARVTYDEHVHDPPRFITEADYLDSWAGNHYEWADGELIAVSTNLLHALLTDYLRWLLNAYIALNPIGWVVGEPFVLRYAEKRRYRSPDLMLVLKTGSVGTMTDTGVLHAADLCIEVVSPESVERDTVTKLKEYDAFGVREYWIFDPDARSAHCYRRNTDGKLARVEPDADENYRTPLLPRFVLHIPTLWTEPLPNIFEAGDAVRRIYQSEAT